MGILSSIGSVVGGLTGMPWLGGIGGAIDAMMDKDSGRSGQNQANDFNAQQAQLNRDFQERMRATQYQTTVKDLQAAGLNPMLAYSNGGAGTPSGAVSAPAQSAVGAGMSSAKQGADTAMALKQLEMTDAQIQQVKAGTAKIQSETMDQNLNTARLLNEVALGREDILLRNRQSSLTFQQMLKTAAETSRTNEEVGATNALKRQRELDIARGTETFSADVARRKAESALAQYELPKAKAEADWMEQLGRVNPSLKTLLMIFQGLNSARSLGR